MYPCGGCSACIGVDADGYEVEIGTPCYCPVKTDDDAVGDALNSADAPPETWAAWQRVLDEPRPRNPDVLQDFRDSLGKIDYEMQRNRTLKQVYVMIDYGDLI